MRLRRIHHLVVRNDTRVVGTISAPSVDARDAEGIERIDNAMTGHVVTGTPDMTVREAANLIRGRAQAFSVRVVTSAA